MMEVFKQVKMNLHLLDDIKQIPSYAKFIKDLCNQKHRIRSCIPKKVCLTTQVSSLIQHNTLPKFMDPSAPTISYIIGNRQIDNTLLDLGKCVNLLPYSLCEQLGLGELSQQRLSYSLHIDLSSIRVGSLKMSS
jgi:hypothetical protein